MKRTQLWICLFATLLTGVFIIWRGDVNKAFMLTFAYGIVALFIEENFEGSHPIKKTLGAIAIIVYCIILYLLLNAY